MAMPCHGILQDGGAVHPDVQLDHAETKTRERYVTLPGPRSRFAIVGEPFCWRCERPMMANALLSSSSGATVFAIIGRMPYCGDGEVLCWRLTWL